MVKCEVSAGFGSLRGGYGPPDGEGVLAGGA